MRIRTKHGGTVRASVMAPLVEMLDRHSGRTDLVLAAQGLLRAEVADPYSRIPLARYIGLFETAAKLLDQPYLGLRLGEAMRPADLGPLGMLFATCPTLGVGLATLARSLSALQSGTLIRLEKVNRTRHFLYQIEDPTVVNRVQDTDFTLAATTALCRTLAGRTWQPIEVHFDHERPGETAPYRSVFRCPLYFGMPVARLVLSAKDFDSPRQPHNFDLTAILERHISDLASQNDAGTSLADRTRALVRARLLIERVTVAQVATDLGTSARSLQRELHAEGTSLREIVREERCALASARLRCAEPSGSIAATIGYADATVFWRAFKTWTGMSPSQYRRTTIRSIDIT